MDGFYKTTSVLPVLVVNYENTLKYACCCIIFREFKEMSYI
jgi:hypothetical protein